MTTALAASDVIDEFAHDGRYGALSNFSPYPVEHGRFTYPTREHAFAAAKTDDSEQKEQIRRAPTPGQAKKLGHRVTLRAGWDAGLRVEEMAAILRSCFTAHSELEALLLSTGDSLLIEGNDWGDRFWGRAAYRGSSLKVGTNMLGRLLMQLRRELRDDPPTRWPRIALTGHREETIDALGARGWVEDELARLAEKLRNEHSSTIALSGLALGSDTWWARAAMNAGLDLWGYSPFPEQARPWNAAQQDEYARLRALCTRLTEVGPTYQKCYYAFRNEVMVGDAEAVIAVYDPLARNGGTMMTMQNFCIGRTVIRVNIRDRRTTLSTPFPGI